MVNVTIDGVRVSVEENTTIMDAAAAVGVRIPRLCYLKDINEIGGLPRVSGGGGRAWSAC